MTAKRIDSLMSLINTMTKIEKKHFSSQGIKVYKDKLYLGFTARGIQDVNTKHYQNIIVFDKAKK